MRIVIITLILMCFCTATYATTYNVDSLDPAVIQETINSASDGDTIYLPTGTREWTSGVLIKDKMLNIIGAGVGKTIIKDSTSSSWMAVPIWIETSTGKSFRISGITFRQGTYDVHGVIKVRGKMSGWRIDNCNFDNYTSGNALSIEGLHKGVIDHCNFNASPGNFKCFQISGRYGNSGEELPGDTAWSQPLSLGTDNAVFIENCNIIFNNGWYAFLDGDTGARIVFRYNKVVNGYFGTHGHDGAYKHRGVLSYEIYNNDFSSKDAIEIYTTFGLRSGTGVIHDNSFSGGYRENIALYNYCSTPGAPNCTAWPTCSEYPCPDQIGRAPDTNNDNVQELEPLYEWNNSWNSMTKSVYFLLQDEVKDIIVLNRDFYIDTPRPNYSTYTYPHPIVTNTYSEVRAPENLKVISSTTD